jgi:putative YhbY family RNA-binding protein
MRITIPRCGVAARQEPIAGSGHESAGEPGRQIEATGPCSRTVRARYNLEMALALTSRQRAHLKARAHVLEPILHIGKTGVQDSVVAEVDTALKAHELIKMKINDDDRDAREAMAEDISTRTGAAIVQRVGKVVVLWRPKPDEPPAAD